MRDFNHNLNDERFLRDLSDDTEGLRAINHRLGGDTLIERGQLAPMRMSERQQITIGNVGGVQDSRCAHMFTVEQRYVVGPEGVSGQLSECRKQFSYGCGGTRGRWVSRMAEDTQNSVFCQGAGCPCPAPLCGKPVMCAVVLHMGGIDQSNQDVDVQKKLAHGSSSRNLCTNSELTRGAPLRSFKSGTPFRVLRAPSEGESARLASEEMTSPTDFFSCRAISLAALSTSSSIQRVVRIRHQASYTRCGSMINRVSRLPVVARAWRKLFIGAVVVSVMK